MLCQQSISPALREEVLRRLSTHKFGHADHQLLFWALSQLPSREPALIRDLLATRLTLLGFPDFELDPFFNSPPPAEGDVSALLARI